MRWRAVCKLASRLPEVLHGETYGTPVLAVRGSFMAILSDDGRSLLVKAEDEDRLALCARNPRAFSPGGPTWNGSTVAVRLSKVDQDDLEEVLLSAWRRSAPPSLIAATGATPELGRSRR